MEHLCKTKKKNATSSGMMQSKSGVQDLESERSPKLFLLGRVQTEQMVTQSVPGCIDSINSKGWINWWDSYRTWIHWCTTWRVGPSSQGSKWLANNMGVFKELYLTMGTSFPSFLSSYFKIRVTMVSFYWAHLTGSRHCTKSFTEIKSMNS